MVLAQLGLVRDRPVDQLDDDGDEGLAERGDVVLDVRRALGLILPKLTGILPVLTSVAAFAIVALQVGAIATHVRRKETVIPNVVIVALGLFVGIGWLLV